MAFTKTKEQCTNCGHTMRTRGLLRTVNGVCWNCREKTLQWHTVSWGPEKYAQGRTGKEVNPIFAKK